MPAMDRNNFSLIPELLWARVEPWLEEESPASTIGRPRVPAKRILAGVLYRLRTGCQWKAIPRQFGSGSTCHRRFQQWVQLGLFEALFAEMVKLYDELCGVELAWASLDTAMVKAPKGGTSLARIQPTEPKLASNDIF